jgi:wyosine [tRNA(Phe)-imidazoG37] synthetase (radical SAM superfamily)
MSVNRLHSEHERQFAANRFVYPVLSRRSGGISVGINLNPSKLCNFDCVYCQVDRQSESETRFVDTPRLLDELNRMLHLVTSGEIYSVSKFRDTPSSMRHLTDIAFSGDGEPTTYKNLDEVVAACAQIKRAHQLHDTSLLLITNASMFHRDQVQRALEILDANQGMIWAKLDAGTEDYFRQVNRAPFTLAHVVRNITQAAQVRPLFIQSLFVRMHGQKPPPAEVHAYCELLCQIVRSGGQIKGVQIYTVARPPAESFVSALTAADIEELVSLVRHRTQLNVLRY